MITLGVAHGEELDGTICPKCGWLHAIGDWPYCGRGKDHQRGTNSVVGDEIVGGFVQENFGHAPETFYSKQAMARRAKELNLESMVRYSGPNDRHVPRWATSDPQTMANAEALIARVHK